MCCLTPDFVRQVSTEALKEARKPLLDLDDVERLENELAACFEAPPPPPLNIMVSLRVTVEHLEVQHVTFLCVQSERSCTEFCDVAHDPAL